MNARSISAANNQFSVFGKWASFTSLLFVFSIDAKYRLDIGGLLVHPYLLILPVAIFFSGMTFVRFPRLTLYPLLCFFFFFSLASLQNISPFTEILKVGSSLFTFLFFVQSVQSEKDFRWVSWGFLVVAVVIGVTGFLVGEEADLGGRLAGVNTLEGLGNKNAQSLFTLPGLFLSMYLVIYYLRRRKFLLIGILLVSIFFITVQVFLSANRSGWIGLGVIFVSYVLYLGFRKTTLLVAVVLIGFSYIAVRWYASDIFERKKKQTIEGYGSDVGRKELMYESIMVGIEHPLFGIGFDRLTNEMADRLNLHRFGIYRVDTHFLIGYIFGATGIFTLISFFTFFWRLCRDFVPRRVATLSSKKAWLLLVCFVFLFLVRSFFSREILYSPPFMAGLGLLYGYYLLQSRNALAMAVYKEQFIKN